MKLSRLTMEGFRSFAQRLQLDFKALPPGLYHVAGENRAEPELGGNGAGKSSIFEAIYWALFGKLTRNLKAGAVRTWGGDRCKVELATEEAVLYRTWNPNSLSIDGEEVDQQFLEQFFRFTPDLALNTYYFAQGANFFLDKGPSERMEVYSSVLGLDLWEHKSDEAKAMAKEAEKAAHAIEVEHARLDAQWNTLQSIDLEQQRKAWDKQHTHEVTKCNEAIAALEEQIGGLAKEHDEAQAALASVQRDLSAWRTSVAEARKAAAAATKAATTAENASNALKAELGEAKTEVERFVEVGTGTCPTCGQAINKTHAKAHKAFLEGQVKQAAAKLKAHQLVVWQAQEAESSANEAVEAAEREDLNGWSSALSLKVGQLETKLAELNRRKFNHVLSLKALKKERNPYVMQAADNAKRAAEVKQQRDDKAAELTEVRNLQARFEFWIKGFRDVRFQVMQESLTQLNAEANECLHQLGLVDWHIEFVVEKETKSKTVKRGFMCEITSPYTTEPVPWEAWSFGEAQRLRIAAQLGVSNMLAARAGLEFNVEMWDEPSNWLSPAGVKDLLAVLRDRALRYERIIFVADHRSFDFDFDGRLVVVKEAGTGSTFGAVELQ